MREHSGTDGQWVGRLPGLVKEPTTNERAGMTDGLIDLQEFETAAENHHYPLPLLPHPQLFLCRSFRCLSAARDSETEAAAPPQCDLAAHELRF